MPWIFSGAVRQRYEHLRRLPGQTPVNARSLNTEQVLRRCALRLPAYMVPKSIEVVDALPKTPNGKIDYKSLRAERVGRSQ